MLHDSHAPDAASAADRVLTPGAVDFVRALHRKFNPVREALLARRADRQAAFGRGATPDFLPETGDIRRGTWQIASVPPDLQDRRVEITGPADRKMMINALNSGARVFMADLEDSLSPTWENVLTGHANLVDAVRRRIAFTSPEGKEYRLNDMTATLLVRPRGWHLFEKHLVVDDAPVSASLCDFGLYAFHNARELLDRGSGPYFYLAKLESHLEARLWNDVFCFAEESLRLPAGSIKATVLIETIPAAFEMHEILYELREHAAGLNAGRWDYIFSLIKKFHHRPDMVLPDRAQVTMTVPFMRSYCRLLVQTCHRRGAHAIGGMAAQIPSRDPRVNVVATAKVQEDKQREAADGFDGTWVAHPGIVAIAREAFDAVLGDAPHQKQRLREDVDVTARDLLDVRIPDSGVTLAGVRTNVNVTLQYLDSWLSGNGAAAINNLMEDAATAEISRAQLWQWIAHAVPLRGGGAAAETADTLFMTREVYERIRVEELSRLGGPDRGRLREASALLDRLVTGTRFAEFLTLPSYEYLA